MAKRPKTVFVCQECGAQSPKWLGRCADCGAWNSLVEERPPDAAAGAGAAAHRYALAGAAGAAQLYADIELEQHARLSTGIDEFDRVLGGGVVPGSLVLLGGEPGIGKSTLLLQAAANMARTIGPVLYSSGEESEHQIKSRGERLGVGDAPLYLLAETCLERILEEIARIKPALVIVDSVQTVFSLKFQSAPGSIGQVREAATQLLFAAKGQNVPTFLVGHVTKDGSLAGPKALEHVVDTVLYFEGERHHSHRVVRAVKNRFGAVSELGVFEMTGDRPASRCRTRRSCFSPSGRRTRPGRRCCARSKARGRFWSRCRRSSAPAPTATRGGWRAASISSGCRCCSRCSKSAPASNLIGDDVFVNIAGGMTRRRAGVRSGRARGDRLERPQPGRSRRPRRCSARSGSPAKSAASRRRRCASAKRRRWDSRRCIMPEANIDPSRSRIVAASASWSASARSARRSTRSIA